ncbi:hypothetical protein IFO70_38715 [Phormidium tenue FACHB-886]|nr:hypothetical protein [Phormidium tenue FACHB-886]
MIPDSVVKQIENKYQHLRPFLNERSRRLWAATEAEALGYGGILALHRATGLSQNTIHAELKELRGESTDLPTPERICQAGGGRKRVEEREPLILEALDSLVDPTSRGEPQCPLRWTCKSVNQLADTLQKQGYRVCAMTRNCQVWVLKSRLFCTFLSLQPFSLLSLIRWLERVLAIYSLV